LRVYWYINQCNVIVGNDGGANEYGKSIRKPSLLSSLIEKKIWATLEDGIHHLSVHLNDYRPELLSQKTEKNLNRMLLPYKEFKPTFKEKLKSFY
jgi:heptosyltransferase-2